MNIFPQRSTPKRFKSFLAQFFIALFTTFLFFQTSASALSYEQLPYLKTINFDQLESFLQPAEDTIVAVLDSGVQIGHEDFQNHLWVNEDEIPNDGIDNDENGYIDDVNGFNFLDNNNDLTPKNFHGTGVAGIIAANRDNNIGIDGIATRAKIMTLVACGEDTTCQVQAVIDAILYAVDNGAKIINLSLGGSGESDFFAAFDEIVEYAYSKGALIIAAAGNGNPDTLEGYNLDVTPLSPVCNDNGDNNMILGIGATILDGSARASWSNYGKCVDLYAPGENIALLTNSNHLYLLNDGTSFAAPLISGIAAEIFSSYPNLSNKQISELFLRSTQNGLINGELLKLELQNLENNNFARDLETDSMSQPEVTNTLAEAPPSSETPDFTMVQPTITGDITSLKDLNYFSDVPSANKYAPAINYLRKTEIVAGYSENIFKPNQFVTRAEILKMLIKGKLGIEPDSSYAQPCFQDIKEDEWHTPYICYAKEKGWAAGYPDGNFRPNQKVNLVEALKFLVMINDVELVSKDLSYEENIRDTWYGKYIETAYALGILENEDNILRASQPQTRAQIAEQIFRLLVLQTLGEEHFDTDAFTKFEESIAQEV